MRIIAGQFRGISLASVGKGDAGAHLRPTTDRVRENLFNILMGGRFGDPITGARVLDLFAGTGALGLEALSRGAESVCFVDNGRKSQSLIRENIRLTRAQDRAKSVSRPVEKIGLCPDAPYDLIFLDPPYGKSLGQKALNAAQEGGWIAANALIVFEENAPQTPSSDLETLDVRKFGDTHVTFMQPVGRNSLG